MITCSVLAVQNIEEHKEIMTLELIYFLEMKCCQQCSGANLTDNAHAPEHAPVPQTTISQVSIFICHHVGNRVMNRDLHLHPSPSPASAESAAQQTIISLLQEIREEQKRQWAVLRDLQAQLRGQSGHGDEDVESLDMDLPLMTLEQLDRTESLLEDAALQKRMVVRTHCNLQRSLL